MSDLTVASTTDQQADIDRAAGITTKEAPPVEPKEGEEEQQQVTPTQESKPKSAYQKRIDRLVRERSDATREVEELKAKLLKFEQPNGNGQATQEAQTQTTQETTQAQTPAKPEAKDYATVEEWVAALADWQTDRKLEALQIKEAEKQALAQQEQAIQAAAKAYQDRLDVARERYEDFDDVAFKNLEIYEGVKQIIMDHPNGPDLQYFIGSNPKIAKELRDLPVHLAMARAGALADEFSRGENEELEEEEETVPAARPKKKAPAPIRPVSGSSTKSSVPIDELPYQEYRKIRDQQERSRYRR